MKLRYLAFSALSSALCLVACGDDDTGGAAPPGAAGTGGTASGKAGASGKGGTSAKGGASGKGGSSAKGGGAGATSKGGAAGKGGTPGKGGSPSTGGASGAPGEGGGAGTGGASGKGGGAGASGAAGKSGGAGKAGGAGTGGATAAGAAGANAGGSDAAGSNAGGSEAGGSDAGGSNAGGSDAGGANAGGTNAGGTNAGGTNAGGTNAGGTNAGGSNLGGNDAGGSAGNAAGGNASAGTSAGGGSAGTAGSGGSPSCTEITVTGVNGGLYPPRVAISLQNFGGPERDAGTLFFDEKPALGTYNLGVGLNADPNTAKQAVYGFEDIAAGDAKVRYASTSGALTVSAAKSVVQIKGEVVDVTLREVVISGGVISLVSGGRCLHLQSAAYDTLEFCGNNEDCVKGQACDPTTLTCVKSCGGGNSCGNGLECVAQNDPPTEGACYSTCVGVKGATCGGAFTCDKISLAGDGYCRPAGIVNEGEVCEGQFDTVTDCAPGLLCTNETGNKQLCRNTCVALTPSPGCSGGQVCTLGGLCTDRLDLVDGAGLNAPCQVQVENRACGLSNGGTRGLCLSSPTGVVCRGLVIAPAACPSGYKPTRVDSGVFGGPDVNACVP